MKWILVALLVPLTAGCLSCEPLLEVRHCLDGPCEPSPDAVEVNWTAEHAAAWPEIDAFMAKVEEGEHEHMRWDEARRQELWGHFGVDASAARPELLVFDQGEWYRVRVLRC